ncbi:MAG: TetR/AcrR family transcriptional regulator [Coriobacteriales bacterium]|nr:TetR/AcrR family transcriptional regulator [Coriobacteriales bacterium]
MRRKNVTTQMMKEYLAESLLLLMRSKAYPEITISAITEKAGVNRSTYYRNFSSKEDIIAFYFSNLLHGYSTEYLQARDHSFENYMHTIFCYFFRHKRELLLIHKNGLSYLILETLNKAFKEHGGESLDVEAQFKAYFHIGGIYNTYLLWFSHDMRETPEELTRISLAQLPSHAKPTLLGLFLQ